MNMTPIPPGPLPGGRVQQEVGQSDLDGRAGSMNARNSSAKGVEPRVIGQVLKAVAEKKNETATLTEEDSDDRQQ